MAYFESTSRGDLSAGSFGADLQCFITAGKGTIAAGCSLSREAFSRRPPRAWVTQTDFNVRTTGQCTTIQFTTERTPALPAPL
jgi:hypothetical protein